MKCTCNWLVDDILGKSVRHSSRCAGWRTRRRGSVSRRPPTHHIKQLYADGDSAKPVDSRHSRGNVVPVCAVPAGTRIKQEAQLVLTNPRNAFRGQPRSPNSSIPYVRYSFLLCNSNLGFYDIRLQKMSWPWNRGQSLLKVIEKGTILYTGYGFLLMFYGNFSS